MKGHAKLGISAGVIVLGGLMLSGCGQTTASRSSESTSLQGTTNASPTNQATGNVMKNISLNESKNAYSFIPANQVEQIAINMMEMAKKGQSVNLEIYEFTSMKLAQHLAKIEQEGVNVHVIMDVTYKGASTVSNYLEQHHVPVESLKVGSSKYHDIDHVKFFEVDDAILMGGVNWGTYSGETTDGDYLVPDVNNYGTKLFQMDWKLAKEKGYTSPKDYQSLSSSGLYTGTKIQPMILSAINGAKKRIDVYMFAFDDKTLVNALIDAKKRGVDVTVRMDSHYEKHLNTSAYNALQASGVHVSWESPNNVLHAKIAVIDNQEVIGGSANWTNSGMRYNHELDVDIHSSLTAKSVEQYFG